jgi:phage-related protein
MGFTYNGKHSDIFNIGVSNIQRSLKPSKRVFKTVIGGRDGTHDFTDNTYSNILFTMTCDYLGTDIGKVKNDIALWLSTSGELVIDGEEN